MSKQNQFLFTVNKGEDTRHSEIPQDTFNKPSQQLSNQAGINQHRKSSSDEETKQNDKSPNNFNLTGQRARPVLLQKAWKYDPSQIGDQGKFSASRQIVEQLSKPLPYTTIAIILLALLVSGFKGPAFLLIDLNNSQNSLDTNENCIQDSGNDITNCDIPEMQQIKGGYALRVCWREMISALMLIPLVVSEYRREQKEEIEENRLYSRDHLLQKRQIFCIFICGLSYAAWTMTLCFAVFNTSIANAYIFNNIFPLFTLIAKLSPFNNHSHSNRTEILGGLLTTAVLVFLVLEDRSGAEGCLISLLGAIAASIFENLSTTTGQGIPGKFLAFSVSIVTVISTGIYSLILEGATLGNDEYTGIFGVWSFKWIIAHVLISFVTGFAKTEIDSFLDKALSSLTKDVSVMTQAFPAILVATILGFGQLPNLAEILTYIVYIVALSFLAVGKSESQIEEIALHDENNLKNLHQNQQLLKPQGNQTGIELTNTLQVAGQIGQINQQHYQPPAYSPPGKQFKKTTMGGYENEVAMNEGFKSKLLAQQQDNQYSSQHQLEDYSHQLTQPQNYHDNFQNDQINNNMNNQQNYSNGDTYQNNNNNNYQNFGEQNQQVPQDPIKEEEQEQQQGYFLNDSIGNFNMEFIKNLKKNKAKNEQQ